MDNFEGTIVYCALSYILMIFLFRSEGNDTHFWDYMTVLFAPISIPIMVIYCLIKVIFE